MRLPVPLRLLVLTVLIVGLSTQPVFLLGAGFVQISADLDISVTSLGAMTALFWLTASVSSPIAGRVVRRIGWRTALGFTAVGSSVILLAIAAFAQSAVAMGALMAAAALVYSGANPAANQVLSEYVDPTRRALIFGLKHAGIPFSTLVAGLTVPILVVSVGWRWAYAAAAVLGLVALAILRTAPRPPGCREKHDPRRQMSPLSRSHLVGLGAGSAMATWAAIALSTYLVAASVDAGISESAAGLLLFGGSLTTIAMRVAVGHMTDRIGGRGFEGMVALTAIGAVLFALMPLASGPAFAVLVLATFATGWAWPGLMTFSIVNANPDSVAESSAIAQAGILVGAGASPLILAWVAETWSFDAIWLVVTVALVISTIVVYIVGRSAVAMS